MLQNEKETILLLVKSAYENKNFNHHYLLPYEEFFDTRETFTDFQGERSDGKAQYVSLIEQLSRNDENAQIFVEIYGYEEDDNDVWIYADTLIIFSELPIQKVEEIFYGSEAVFPSEIGRINDFSEGYSIVKEGVQYPANQFCDSMCNVYYCWWD